MAYNTAYSFAAIYLPTTAGSTAANLLGYQITRLLSSPSSQPGDNISVTYSYLTSVPGAPGMPAHIPQPATITLNPSQPPARPKTATLPTPAGRGPPDP